MGNNTSSPAGEAEVADGQGHGAPGHAAAPTRSDAGSKRGSRAREQAPSNPMSPLFSAHTQPTNHGRVVLDLRGVPTDPDASSYAIWVERVPQQRRSYAADQDPGMGLMSLLSSVGGTLITLLTAQKLWEEVQTLRAMRSQAGRSSSASSRGGGPSSSGGAGGTSDTSPSPGPGPSSKPRDSSSRTPALELPTNVPRCTRGPGAPPTSAPTASSTHSCSNHPHTTGSHPSSSTRGAVRTAATAAAAAQAVPGGSLALPCSSSSGAAAASCGPAAPTPSALTTTSSSSSSSTNPTTTATSGGGYGSGAWAAIAGLEDVKVLLQEATVLPLLRPDLFRGARQPPRGVLLFGPPGTGKTLLARAVAAESGAAFVAITGSNILSKWYGESEANVRQLFKRLSRKAPAVLFIDEVDSLLAKRSGGEAAGGSGTSRRVANEFLSFIDGIQTTHHAGGGGGGSSSNGASSSTSSHDATVQDGPSLNSNNSSSGSSSSSSNSGIVVMAATNAPWDLDEAALSRFAARVLVPLPGPGAREAILRHAMEGVACCLSASQWRQVAERAAGYSGRDLVQVCREASMRPVRELFGNRVLTGSHAEQIWAAQRARLIASLVRALDAGSSSKDLRKQLTTWHTAQQVGWATPEELLAEAQGLLKQQREAAAEKRRQEAAAAKQQRAAEQAARRLQQQQQQQGGGSSPAKRGPPPPGSSAAAPAPAAAAGGTPPAAALGACRQLPPGSSGPCQPPATAGSPLLSSSSSLPCPRPEPSRAGPPASSSSSSSSSSPGVGRVTVALSVQQESGRVVMALGHLPSAASAATTSSSSQASSPPAAPSCTNNTTHSSGGALDNSHHQGGGAGGGGSDSWRRCHTTTTTTSSSTTSSSRVTVQLAVSGAGRVSVRLAVPPASADDVSSAASGDGCGVRGRCHAASAAGTGNTTQVGTPGTSSGGCSSSSVVKEAAASLEGPTAAAAGSGQAGALQLVSHDLHLDQEEVDWSDSEVDREVDQPPAAGGAAGSGSSCSPSAAAGADAGSSSGSGAAGGDKGGRVRTLRDLLTLPPEAIRAVQYEDFDWALQHVASTDFDATNRYQEWAQQYGAGGGALTSQAGWKFMPMYL